MNDPDRPEWGWAQSWLMRCLSLRRAGWEAKRALTYRRHYIVLSGRPPFSKAWPAAFSDNHPTLYVVQTSALEVLSDPESAQAVANYWTTPFSQKSPKTSNDDIWCGSWKSHASSPWAKRTEPNLNRGQPHTGLDDCLRMLQTCFKRKRMSAQWGGG